MSPLTLVGILVIASSAYSDVKHVLEGSAHPPDPNSISPHAVNYLASSPPDQFWWMNSDSPLKAAYDYYKKCNTKGNCLAPVNPNAPPPQPFKPPQGATVEINVKKNPFLNGNYQVGGGDAHFNKGGGVSIDIKKNPFLSGAVVTTGNGAPVVKGQDGFLGVQPAQPFKKPFATTHPLEGEKKPGFATNHPLLDKEGGCEGVCVEKELCVNGIVNNNGEGLFHVRSSAVIHCNPHKETCCQLNKLNDITAGKSSVPDSPIKLAASAGFSPAIIRPEIFLAGEHGHHSSQSTPKSIRDTSSNSVFSSTVDYSDTKFDDDIRFASTFQGPAYLPPLKPSSQPPRPPQTIPVQVQTPSVNQQFVTRPTTPKYVPPPTTPRPVPSTSREYLPPRPSTPRPTQYVPPQTTQRPYQPPSTTQRPYQPPSTTQRPYQPPSTTQRPYQPPSTTQRPYQPPQTPSRPYIPPQTSLRPYQPPSTTQRPYQPPSTTQRPYQPPSTTQRPYQPPSTTQRPYQPPQTSRPYQPSYQPSTVRPSTNAPEYLPPRSQPSSQRPSPFVPQQTTPQPPKFRPTPAPFQPPSPPQPRPTQPPQYPSPSQPQPRPTPPPYKPRPTQPPVTPGYQYPSPSQTSYQPRPSQPQPRPTPAPFQPRPTPTPGYQYPTPSPSFPIRPGPSATSPQFVAPSTPSRPSTLRPYQPPSTTQRPYQPPSTTQRPYQPPSTTQRPYQPPSTTQRPYQPPSTTQRPYQPPSTTQRPYQPPSTPQRPYQPPTSAPNPAGGYVYPKPTPTFGYPTTPQQEISGSNINNQFVQRPTTKKPTTGYLPPNPDQSGEGSANVGSSLVLRPSTQRPQFQGELNTAPPPGCAAALKCVQEIYCTAEGVISPVPVVLTKQQEENRVPTTVCQDTESGIIGKCCRDPNYKDPWPSANLVNGEDDGQYREDDTIGQYQQDLQRNVRSHSKQNNLDSDQSQCGERHSNTSPRGPGPLDVNFAEIPWQAMILRDSNRSLLCGGVIVRRNAVLTAAHCVEGLETSDILIKGGEWKLGIDEEPLPFQIVKVAVVVRHPLYQPGSLINDLALLVLEEKLRSSRNVGTICLPPPNQIPTENCIATGWGKRILQLHAKGAIMHSINVKIMDNGQCQETLANKFQNSVSNYSPNTLCGYSDKDQCRVDYGSALACTSDGSHYTLSGIYAWDTGCKQQGQIGGYIAPDVDWMESTLAKPLKQLKLEQRN